ncbi:uncharacterized protein BDZ99DRAFT_551611 [Mytilinidion resinicola]|uniref:Uncharacterized protein n=1 Tax=Mytilinidion resinicola TaxID=574789 RepID=A0A6A6Y0W5_9PEZI|nr:uncharacterized protein BDZ99DRAFT_551611 [Mytilinidion resinicola]KAF2802289.1 hypothetical protein BDZ99DRAFT_551611 [Mytilinidion resinicola]
MWQDLEYLINLHTPHRLFVGSRPAKPEEFSSRSHLVCGVPAVQVAKSRGRLTTTDRFQFANHDTRRKRRFQIESPLMLLLRERYLGDLFPMAVQNLSAYLVRKLDEKAAALEPDAQTRPSQGLTPGEDTNSAGKLPEKKMKNKKGKHKKPELGDKVFNTQRPPSKYSATEVLSTLTEELIKEEPHTNFDYLALHHRCVMLLISIQLFFRSECPIMGTRADGLPPHMLPALAFTIMNLYSAEPESRAHKDMMIGIARIMKTGITKAGRAELDRLEDVY